MNENEQISLKDLFVLFWSHLWILLLALAIGGGGAYAYTKYMIEPQYSSHISMYVQTYTVTGNQTDNVYNDINKSKQLINTYIQVLKDDAVMDSVGAELCKQFDESIIADSFAYSNGKIRASSLASCIAISTVTDTSAIKIVATTKDPKLSAAVCNVLCDQANDFTDRAIGVGEIKSIDTAKVYPHPVSPNIVKNTAMGGIALMILAAFIIFLIDFFDTTIKNSDVVTKRFQKAILGEIDDIAVSKKKKTEELVTLLHENTPFNIVESYKSIRTNITFALSTSEKKALIVSSANPGEGKSTTAANIAITMADEGQKVLLIDADMRKPTQHIIFDVKNETGLSSVLSKMKTTEECIQKTALPTLSILTSGPIPPNPSELLSSPQTAALLEKASEEFSTIIIDSPPVNVVSDTLNLSPYVAGMLSVVRCGFTTDDDLKALLNKTEMAHMEVLGCVLTRVKRKKSNKYYYKHYGKYGYYSTDSNEKAAPAEEKADETKIETTEEKKEEQTNSKQDKKNKKKDKKKK
ncbi:MAG: polysaccharide biosynthesis tyrosine autokinase [Oscillospiraceae bacterium]|nr:polysaccharide biosynthesis tyrosine autokinase [Oscillospiraceae bacterium]